MNKVSQWKFFSFSKFNTVILFELILTIIKGCLVICHLLLISFEIIFIN